MIYNKLHYFVQQNQLDDDGDCNDDEENIDCFSGTSCSLKIAFTTDFVKTKLWFYSIYSKCECQTD